MTDGLIWSHKWDIGRYINHETSLKHKWLYFLKTWDEWMLIYDGLNMTTLDPVFISIGSPQEKMVVSWFFRAVRGPCLDATRANWPGQELMFLFGYTAGFFFGVVLPATIHRWVIWGRAKDLQRINAKKKCCLAAQWLGHFMLQYIGRVWSLGHWGLLHVLSCRDWTPLQILASWLFGVLCWCRQMGQMHVLNANQTQKSTQTCPHPVWDNPIHKCLSNGSRISRLLYDFTVTDGSGSPPRNPEPFAAEADAGNQWMFHWWPQKLKMIKQESQICVLFL